MDALSLASLFREAHNAMRNIDGLQPQESFDELLKFLYFLETRDSPAGTEFALTPDNAVRGRLSVAHAARAKEIRGAAKAAFRAAPPAISSLWPDGKFRLSDECLVGLDRLFSGVNLSGIDLDVRSAAIREFLSPEIRKGLGIYLTPEDVVRASVSILSPTVGSKVLDPACGSGTFLLEVARRWARIDKKAGKRRVWGIDKNPRMLVLADLNLGHLEDLELDGQLLDSLMDTNGAASSVWYNKFDFVFTNPPFGVYVDASIYTRQQFSSAVDTTGKPFTRQQSEILFIEQCLRFLKPGGRLAIVLPKSVVSNDNDRTSVPRLYFGTQGHVEGIMTLPPETFYATGTQANTVVLFARKYASETEAEERNRIWLAEIDNCGYDSTGRARPGNQLTTIADDIRALMEVGRGTENCRWLEEVRNAESFARIPALLAVKDVVDGVPLRDLTDLITTGRTPARKAYTPSGLFVVKVGNLSGRGIDWYARDRNFINESETQKRRKADLLIRDGDILLTSSAHSPVYIAKKVDVVSNIPQWIGGQASFVGEVMLIRPKQDIVDPYVLLGYLRHPNVVDQIQRMVRGQTAHLHARDLGNLQIPRTILKPDATMLQIADLLKEEGRLAAQSNFLTRRLDELHAELVLQ